MMESFRTLKLSTVAESDVPDFTEPVHFTNEEYMALIKKLELQTNVTEKARIIAQSIDQQRVVVRQNAQTRTAALKTDVTPTSSTDYVKMKAQIEKTANEPLSIDFINKLLEKLPSIESNDTIGRSYVVQYLWGKLRANGYMMTIENGFVRLLAKDSNDPNILRFTETINSHILANKLLINDCTQAIMIGSGTIGEYIETRKANLSEISNNNYIVYLQKKYDLSRNFNAAEINSKNIPDEDKALLLSSRDQDFSRVDLKQVTGKYTEMHKQVKEVLDSKAYKIMEKTTGETPVDVTKLATQAVENPLSLISQYPMTAIALVFGSLLKF